MGAIKEMPQYLVRLNGMEYEGTALRITEVKIRMGSDIPWNMILGFDDVPHKTFSFYDWSRVHNDRWNFPRIDDYLITLNNGVQVLIDPERFQILAMRK